MPELIMCRRLRATLVLTVLLLPAAGGCTQDRPLKTVGTPVSDDVDVRELTINGDSAQAEPLRVESQQPLRFETVVDLPEDWRRPYVGLVRAVGLTAEGNEATFGSSTLTITDLGDNSFQLSADLQAPKRSGDYDLRGAVQIDGCLVTVCSRPIEVVEAE